MIKIIKYIKLNYSIFKNILNLIDKKIKIVFYSESKSYQMSNNSLISFLANKYPNQVYYVSSNIDDKYEDLDVKNLYIGIINKRTLRKGFYNIEGNLNYDPLEIIDQYNILRLKSSSEEEIKKLIPNINDKEMLFIIHPHRKLIKEYIKNKIGESFLTKIHEKYLLDYEILNFRKIDISENLFFDNTHLNAKGSIFYTKIFIDSLKNKNSFNKLFE